jgi:hypothetical protein
MRDSNQIVIQIHIRKEFTGMVARVGGLRARNSPFKAREAGRQAPCRACRDIEGLFESLLSESFGG